jgi:predicted PurR-regulated permease PerM
MQNYLKIDITTGTFLRAALVTLALLFFYQIRHILAIILLSVVIASALEPAIRRIASWHIPRTLAVLLVYLTALGGFGFTSYFLIPPLLEDVSASLVNLPFLIQQAFEQLAGRIDFLALGDFEPSFQNAVLQAESYLRGIASGFLGLASFIFGGITSFVFIIVISFYLAVQEDGVKNFLRLITPKEYEEYLIRIWQRTQEKFGRWMQGQFLLAVIVGALVFIGLTILQVRYALTLALLAAMFEIIPFFGPILAAVPGIIVAFLQAPFLGVSALVLYAVVQQLENHLIYPVVVRKTIGIPPIIAIVALLVGSRVGGFMGFVLAIPLAVILVEIIDDFAARKRDTA